MSHLNRRTTTLLGLLLGLAAAAGAYDGEDASYGYLRTVEGPGRIVQGGSGAGVELAVNYPLLPGDLVEVDPGGRVELSLPDFNVVRLAGGSELLLDRLALSPEGDDDATLLFLKRGELQFLVHDLLPVAERPQVDTANATVYLQSDGVYRIASDGYGWTEVVVRRGFAEIATESGASVVRTGEQAWIEGQRRPRVGIERAGLSDELERWGASLDGELAGYRGDELEPHLAYAAAPLERHGRWVWIEGSRAWRPSVTFAWRPYEIGWWAETPLGLLWVSDEPWAWVTYHYGTWVPTAHYGWVWLPGRRFAPAWVYWYWGPQHVGWVPAGYYTSYYGGHWGRYGPSFRFGLYGYAGGSWGYFSDWTFCSRDSYRRRDLHHHLYRGSRYARNTRSLALERGLIGTDSRALIRATSNLKGSARERAVSPSLPDVTDFVARKRELPEVVSKQVFSDRRARQRYEAFDKPGYVARGDARERALPRAEFGKPDDAWRNESGRLRRPPAVKPLPREQAPPAPRGVAPRERDSQPKAWWQQPGRRSGPPAAADAPRGRRETAAPSERDSVMRRIWERIGERGRPPATEGRPRTDDGDGKAVTPPPARRPVTRKPAPSASERRAPPPRRSSAGERRLPPKQPSSVRDRGSSSRGSSASDAGSRSSRRSSSARSGSRSSGRSSEGKPRSRARRKPPG